MGNRAGKSGITTLARSTALLGVVIALALAPGRADAREQCSAPGITDRYDLHIKIAVKRHWPLPYRRYWCLLKAQCYVESRLEPEVRSPVGATGLCQIMPGTAEEIARHNSGSIRRGESLHATLRDARRNVEWAALYMRRMLKFWVTRRTAEGRVELAWASYNAGAGNIAKAQTASGGRVYWADISPHLYRVTGHHSAETIAYVHRIWSTYRRLTGTGIS